jgi:hypothetical protein
MCQLVVLGATALGNQNRNTKAGRDTRALVALRKRSAPGVEESTVLPTALSRMLNAITAKK